MKLYRVSKNKTGSSDSDHQHLISKFRLKLKKVGKTTRPFRYDLNQTILKHVQYGQSGVFIHSTHKYFYLLKYKFILLLTSTV